MFDPAPQQRPATQSEWVVAVGGLVVVLGLFVAEVCTDYTPVKLSALLVVLFWVPLLAIHEGGHAITAHLLGWRVEQVVIGMGAILGRFRVGTANVEIRMAPVEGVARCRPRTHNPPRCELALIAFAGPGVELLIALLMLAAVGGSQLFSLSNEYPVIICQSLALAAMFQVVFNLIPFTVTTSEGTLRSDGLLIYQSLFGPRREKDNWRSGHSRSRK